MPRLPMLVAAAVLGLGTTSYAAAPVPTSTDEARALSQGTGNTVDAEQATLIARRHAAEMNDGKDHQAAWDATHSTANGEKNAARAQVHARAMNEGKDHESARDVNR